MRKILFLSCLFTVFFVSCKTHLPDQTLIRGQLTNRPGEKIVLTELDTKSIRKVDSAILNEGGKFRFLVKVPEPGFYMVQSQQGKVLVLYARPGDTIDLTGSMISFPDNITVKGPEETLKLEGFFRFTRQNEKRVDSLENLLVEKQDSAGYYPLTLRIDTAFRQIWESQRDYEKAFITRNPGSLISLIALNYAFGFSTVLSPDEDSVWYRKLDSALMKRYPGNKHVKYHHRRLLEFQREREIKKGKKL